MKRLWKYIPPCLSDVMGFQAVMNETDGLGIIDDPGRYKPLSTLGVGNDKPAYMNMQARERGGFEGHGGYGGRGGHGGHGERGGKPGGGRGYGADGQRVVDSALRNEDIISGTEKKEP